MKCQVSRSHTVIDDFLVAARAANVEAADEIQGLPDHRGLPRIEFVERGKAFRRMGCKKKAA